MGMINGHQFFFLNILLVVLGYLNMCVVSDHTVTYTCNCTDLPFDRSEFSPNFLFGAAGASYQIEGAWNVSGKGPSIWDTFTHSYPEKILDRSTGDIATNSYYQYREDLRAAQLMSLDTYRISISWPRLMPNGLLSGGINPDGVQYYNDVIDDTIAAGLEPCVTMFHWDLPQYLEDLYGGFLSPRIVVDFVNYADLLFKLFGDRVTTWVTLNEPLSFSEFGYAVGNLAPGRCSFWFNPNCTGGNSATEPYIVAHHLLLAHATTYRLYKTKYQPKQQGTIGITLSTRWFLPFDPNNASDHEAARTMLDFQFGWYMNSVTNGDYPEVMKELVGSRLPKFTEQEKNLLKGSYDFLGLNYYTGQFVHPFDPDYKPEFLSYETDAKINRTSTDVNGNVLGGGPEYDHIWVQLYPLGLFQLLQRIREQYGNPLIFITENGMCTNSSLHPYRTLNDTERVIYMAEHVCCLQNAIVNGSNVKGMIFWSLTDNFEWYAGYTQNFGLYHIDRDHYYQRIPKYSALWLASHLSRDYVRGSPLKALPPIPSTHPDAIHQSKADHHINHIIKYGEVMQEDIWS